MADDTFRVLAGECTVNFVDGARSEGSVRDRRADRGKVLVVEKPDGTVLVHDRDGYRPVAWLTRADAVAWDRTGATPSLSAVEGDRRLDVVCHDEFDLGRYPASAAGERVGTCPECESALVSTPVTVECLGCDARYGVPRDATVLGHACEACGLPMMAVERGEAFEVCVDRTCESLDDAVRARFDRAWSCPDCGSDLRIIRRGTLIAGCDDYPDCETAFSVPAGTVAGECDACGLPTFETTAGRRCLDATCDGHRRNGTAPAGMER